MKIEITTEGQGVGTVVTIDGNRFQGITGACLSIPADGIAVLTIVKASLNEQGQMTIDADRACLKTEAFQIRGTATFEGEAIAFIHQG